jgi:FeS assembly SUF system protein
MESNGQDSLEDQIVDQVIANLKRVFDPELPLNIYDLGLIYAVKLNKEFDCTVDMTLTSPNCPAAEILPMEVEFATRSVEGINKVHVHLTFDPPWNPDTMVSDEGKYALGIL